MDIDDLFQKYIDVCNHALERNGDIFPFGAILSAVRGAEMGVMTQVQIIDDLHNFEYRLTLGAGGIQIIKNACHGSGNQCCGACNKYKNIWCVKTSYLQDVVSHPEEYISNPATIDWEWLGGQAF